MSAEGADARVAIIIVTYNSRRHFARLKAALTAQTSPFALTVVDNASAPMERPRADDFPGGALIIQHEENVGFAAANNRAAALCEGEFIALLNPDAFPEPDWLAELLAAVSRWPRAAAFGSTQIAVDAPDRYDGLGDCYSAAGFPWRGGFGWPASAPALEGETFSPCAAAALYRNTDWRAAGGFDESFVSYCEDVDLGFRLRLAGRVCVQAAKAKVHHVGSASSGRRSGYAMFHGARNRLWTYVKNMPAPLLLLTLPAHVLGTLTLLLTAPFSGAGLAAWRGVWAGLTGLGPVLRARRRPRAPLAEIAGALTWRPDKLIRRAPDIRPGAAKSR